MRLHVTKGPAHRPQVFTAELWTLGGGATSPPCPDFLVVLWWDLGLAWLEGRETRAGARSADPMGLTLGLLLAIC